jgi:hypothetical protein
MLTEPSTPAVAIRAMTVQSVFTGDIAAVEPELPMTKQHLSTVFSARVQRMRRHLVTRAHPADRGR